MFYIHSIKNLTLFSFFLLTYFIALSSPVSAQGDFTLSISAPTVDSQLPSESAITLKGIVDSSNHDESIQRVQLAMFNQSRRLWLNLDTREYEDSWQRSIAETSSRDQNWITHWQLMTTLEDGQYILLAIAIDSALNKSSNGSGVPGWTTVDFSVGNPTDAEPPFATLTTPVTGENVDPGPLLIHGMAEDSGGSGILRVDVSIKDTQSGQWLDFDSGVFVNGWKKTSAIINSPLLDSVEWHIEPELPTGAYEIVVFSIDKAGNRVRDENNRIVPVRLQFSVGDLQPDTTGPVVTIDLPEANTTVNSALTEIRGTASDQGGSGILLVSFSIYDLDRQGWFDLATGTVSVARTLIQANVVADEIEETSWSADLSLPPSNYQLLVIARDRARNYSDTWQRKRFEVIEEEIDPVDDRPNIVVLLADDLGYADLNEIDMPRMHEILTTRGAKLPLYTMRNCAPTRAAMMTGLIPSRIGITGVDAAPEYRGIDPAYAMLAEQLKVQNYATGAFGKWHLGIYLNQSPLANGFDEYVGFAHGFINNYGPRSDGSLYPDGTIGHDHHGSHDMQSEGVPLYNNRYATFLFSEAATNYIERMTIKDQRQPFFAYVPFNAPHGPYSAPREYVEPLQERFGVSDEDMNLLYEYEDKVLSIPFRSVLDDAVRARLSELLYYASVRALDDAAADIFDALAQTGADTNTLFLFASDNGAGVGLNRYGSNGTLRDGKGSPYEGGHKVANLVVLPEQYGEVPLAQSNVWIGDLYETLLAIAEAPLNDPDIDSVNMLPSLLGGASDTIRKNGSTHIVTHLGKTKKKDKDNVYVTWAINDIDYKYIRKIIVDDFDVVLLTYEELYFLPTDPGENTNLVNDTAHTQALNSARQAFENAGGNEAVLSWHTTTNAVNWADYDIPTEWGFAENPYQF